MAARKLRSRTLQQAIHSLPDTTADRVHCPIYFSSCTVTGSQSGQGDFSASCRAWSRKYADGASSLAMRLNCSAAPAKSRAR